MAQELFVTEPPIYTAAAAVYPYIPALKHKFTLTTRYDDTYTLYRVMHRDDKKYLLIPRNSAPLAVEDLRLPGNNVSFKSNFKPRNEEQALVVARSTSFLNSGMSFITEAPTGFGKTACAMDVIANVGKKVLVVVTKEDLRDQWVAAAKQFLGLTDKDIGFIQADKCQYKSKKLVIAMVQSIAIEDRYPPEAFYGFGLTIFDEVHRMAADHFSNAMWNLPSLLRWGLSATPKRKDGKDPALKAHIGPVRVRAHQLALVPKILVINSGWKVPMTVVKGKPAPIPHSPGKIMHIVKIMAKDKVRNLRLGKFVKASYDKDRKVIFFADTKDHLKAMRDMLMKLGINPNDIAFYVGGLTKTQLAKAKKQKILLATYKYCSEGTDIPSLDTMVLGTPRSDVQQIVGRILREYAGKGLPVVLDLHDGNSSVLKGYSKNRLKWYKKIGAEVKYL